MSSPSQSKEDSAAGSLRRAASNGDLQTVTDLLIAGADVNSANQSGQTALMLAAVMGHERIVESLIEAGADPDLRDRLGLTALEWATRRGFSEVSRILTSTSPQIPEPVPTKASSSQATSETTSQPLGTTAVDSKGQVSEAVRTSPSADHKLNQRTEQELATQPAVPVDVTRLSERSPAPVKSDPVVESVSTTSPISDQVEHPAEQQELATQPAAPVDMSKLPESSPAPVKSDPVVESVPTTSPISDQVEHPAEQQELATQPAAPVDVTRLPESSPARVKSDPVVESVSTTAPISDKVELPAAQQELATQPAAPVDVTRLPESPAAPVKSGPVVESVSTTSPISDKVGKLAEPQEVETPTASTVTPTSPEKEPVPVKESESPLSISPAAQTAKPQPERQVSHLAENVDSVPGSSNAEPQLPLSSTSLEAESENEDEETLTRPPIPVAPRVTPPKTAPKPASRIFPSPEPLERMPWMVDRVDREPSVTASPLSLSSTTTSDASASVSNSKRCPKCNRVYQNTDLSYCTRDYAALVSIDNLHSAAQVNTATPIAVWLLIAFVLGASAFAAYRLTQYFYRAETPAPASVASTPGQPAAAETNKPFFSVGGALAGMEVNVPEPEYPNELQGAEVTGPVTVTIRVNRNGRVISATSSNGDRRLRPAAVRAARQATFAAEKLAEANPRSRVIAGTITYEFVRPQPDTATAPAPLPTNDNATRTPTEEPNAPVVSDTLAGAVVSVPDAEYPARSRRAGTNGTITVTIRVNRSGKVISWRTSPGDSQLRAAAIRAARKASFSQDKLPGSGEVVGTITYNFNP